MTYLNAFQPDLKLFKRGIAFGFPILIRKSKGYILDSELTPARSGDNLINLKATPIATRNFVDHHHQGSSSTLISNLLGDCAMRMSTFNALFVLLTPHRLFMKIREWWDGSRCHIIKRSHVLH